MTTVATALRRGAIILQDATETPRLDAEILLAHVTGRDRTWCITASEDPLPMPLLTQYATALRKRATDTPVAYITEEKEFYGLTFTVTSDVLIPRPDSELMVDVAREFLPTEASVTFVDVGTGSGALAVTLAAQFPASTVIATDISRRATTIAAKNAAQNNVADRVDVRQGDLLSSVPETFDVLVANLPYLSPADFRRTAPNVQGAEPTVALASGTNGLAHYQRLIQQLRQRPASTLPSVLIFECDPAQMRAIATAVAELPQPYAQTIYRALNGEPRVCAFVAEDFRANPLKNVQ